MPILDVGRDRGSHGVRRTLIIGGTRGTGRLIAGLLLRRGERVRVLARRPTRVAASLGEGVEIARGDITHPQTLPGVMAGISHIVFTAGVRSGRPATEGQIKRVEYDGVVNTLAAARDAGFGGRLLYMTASGVDVPSIAATFLNLYKGNTLVWRRRAEDAIRRSALDYTIIRAGMLLNTAGGRRAIEVTQRHLPLTPRHCISRADVAEVFVAALDHPRASRATLEVVWGRGTRTVDLSALLDRLEPDATRPRT